MALTRPTIQNINTNLTTFTDSLTVTNFGNVANRDIGEVFDRSQGGGSNVAAFWQESTKSFAFAYTSSTGKDAGNLTVTSYANLTLNNITAGNITAGNLIVSNVVYQNAEFVTTSETIAGNSTVNGLTVNTSATIGTTLSVTGNLVSGSGSGGTITGANVISANYFVGNGSGLTSITAANITGTIANATFAATAGTVTTAAQGNITSVGTLTSLTLSGTLIGTSITASNFGNNGANFTGNVFSIGSANVSGNVSISGTTSLDSIAKFTIPGGAPGYVIKTDGSGTLSWQPDNSGGITYTANIAPPTYGNLTGDQWYNTTSDVLYEYSFDGVNYYWVDQSGAAFGDVGGSGGLSPFLLMGA